MMANGALVRVLIRTSVTKYLNFKAVDGSFVYNKGKVWFLSEFESKTVIFNEVFGKPMVLLSSSRFTKYPQMMLKHSSHH